jgi:hypothetical protein
LKYNSLVNTLPPNFAWGSFSRSSGTVNELNRYGSINFINLNKSPLDLKYIMNPSSGTYKYPYQLLTENLLNITTNISSNSSNGTKYKISIPFVDNRKSTYNIFNNFINNPKRLGSVTNYSNT